MLDTPLSSNFTLVQASLQEGEIRTLSAAVGGTYASLNSTKDSPERADSQYWSNISARLNNQPTFNDPWGDGSWFGMWNGDTDISLVFLSYYNQTLNQTFESEANGFNLYRGTCIRTWLVTSSSITLQHATDFQTDWSPSTLYVREVGLGQTEECRKPSDGIQTVITCNWAPLSPGYYTVLAENIVPSIQSQNGTNQLSVWVAVVAATEWASLAAMAVTTLYRDYPYVTYRGSYELTSTVVTMKRSPGLFAVLSVLPLLIIIMLIARIFLYTTPVSENFGITTLLAGASRSSLDVLDGAEFSGELT
jgi:hypothetical protein